MKIPCPSVRERQTHMNMRACAHVCAHTHTHKHTHTQNPYALYLLYQCTCTFTYKLGFLNTNYNFSHAFTIANALTDNNPPPSPTKNIFPLLEMFNQNTSFCAAPSTPPPPPYIHPHPLSPPLHSLSLFQALGNWICVCCTDNFTFQFLASARYETVAIKTAHMSSVCLSNISNALPVSIELITNLSLKGRQ